MHDRISPEDLWRLLSPASPARPQPMKGETPPDQKAAAWLAEMPARGAVRGAVAKEQGRVV